MQKKGFLREHSLSIVIALILLTWVLLVYPLKPRHAFRIVFRQRHRRLVRPSGHRAGHQVSLREGFSGKPQAQPSLAQSRDRSASGSLFDHFSSRHWRRMDLALRDFRSQLKVGTSRRQHRVRMDADLRSGHPDQEVDGSKLERKQAGEPAVNRKNEATQAESLQLETAEIGNYSSTSQSIASSRV